MTAVFLADNFLWYRMQYKNEFCALGVFNINRLRLKLGCYPQRAKCSEIKSLTIFLRFNYVVGNQSQFL